jgi:hypothetical protein
MDVATGEVKPMANFVKELGTEEFNKRVNGGRIIPIQEADMTDEQKERIASNEQPVVPEADKKSVLYRIKNWHRNKPCRCNSLKKYKNCCMGKDRINNFQLLGRTM